MLLKVSLLVLMVVTNTIGCTFFVKALNGSESSLPATVASTATNYVCSVSNRIFAVHGRGLLARILSDGMLIASFLRESILSGKTKANLQSITALICLQWHSFLV